MAQRLHSDIVHNPSEHLVQWPGEHGQRPLDLSVVLSVGAHDRVEMIALANGKRAPRTRVHRAGLEVSGSFLRGQADRLRRLWHGFVHHQPVDEEGMPHGPAFPFAATHDLRSCRDTVRPKIAELADSGAYTLSRLLAGTDSDLVRFREFLLSEFRDEGLRISFDSDLSLPWPMLAVRTEGAEMPSFLGHRHEIEQTGASYAPIHSRAVRAAPAASLNSDTALAGVGRAEEVAELLHARTELTVRTHSDDLLKSLAVADFDEDLMYFWCHGAVEEYGSHRTVGIRLSDDRTIDADLVHQYRAEVPASPGSVFRPFVLFNACYAGLPTAEAGLEHLGRAFVEQGATGVLGPQIEIPQNFASEYAHAFLDRYLTGTQTAGEICRALVRHFLDEMHNPLALTYLLYCGIDSFLETRPCTSSPLTSTNEDGSARPTVVIPFQATGSPSTSPNSSGSHGR